MSSLSKIHLATDLKSYFESQVSETVRKQAVEISPASVNYLAQVLLKFTKATSFFMQNKESIEAESKQEFPRLSSLFMESMSSTVPDRFFHLQNLGDTALFTCGFFPEKIDRNLVDRDYYIAVGGMAYEQVGQFHETLQAERYLNIFFELSKSFSECSEIFAELSDQSLLNNDKDLIKLYEKWLKTRSQRISRMLVENKIIPAVGSPLATEPRGSSGES